MIRDIVFEDDGGGELAKKIAGYHQYHAGAGGCGLRTGMQDWQKAAAVQPFRPVIVSPDPSRWFRSRPRPARSAIPQHFPAEDLEWAKVRPRRRSQEECRGPGRRASPWSQRPPTVLDGLFSAPIEGTRQGKTGLGELRDEIDPETGEAKSRSSPNWWKCWTGALSTLARRPRTLATGASAWCGTTRRATGPLVRQASLFGRTGVILLNPGDACPPPPTKGHRHADGHFQHGNDRNIGGGVQESRCTAERPGCRRRLARTDRTCKTSSRGRSKGTTRKAADLPYEIHHQIGGTHNARSKPVV